MKTVWMQPINRELNVYLADDDEADCILRSYWRITCKVKPYHSTWWWATPKFALSWEVNTSVVSWPQHAAQNGFAALGQIARRGTLNLPVIVYSTANEPSKINMVLGMLHTITFVSLPNLLNKKYYIKQ
jgi:hypothetical protein